MAISAPSCQPAMSRLRKYPRTPEILKLAKIALDLFVPNR